MLSAYTETLRRAVWRCVPKGLVAVTGAKVVEDVRLVKTIETSIPRELEGEAPVDQPANAC